MNRLNELFTRKKERVLSIYFTAGYPELNSTLNIAEKLEAAGADFIEIGFPYSDPLADGPVIQNSSQFALQNGMSLKVLFEQLQKLRERISIPVLLMGYFNPVLQFGVENFCRECAKAGIDGVIIPDLPMYEYEEMYRDHFLSNNISNIFLVTPQTTEERIRKIDELSTGFIYLLSSSATTGKNLDISDQTYQYFSRIKGMNLKNPTMVGFGISDQSSFDKAAQYTCGAIVGSAFVKFLETENSMNSMPEFIAGLRQ